MYTFTSTEGTNSSLLCISTIGSCLLDISLANVASDFSIIDSLVGVSPGGVGSGFSITASLEEISLGDVGPGSATFGSLVGASIGVVCSFFFVLSSGPDVSPFLLGFSTGDAGCRLLCLLFFFW